ncbi:hypothetical protein [Vibrio mexicanus]|uniref:cyanobactin maturation protease PatG family protein n=1 Tax=Vibrio mexicanus TaxID=1004326 RepID=UPI00063C6116|nr:hypothetical protein [Vibrio mexicanus]
MSILQRSISTQQDSSNPIQKMAFEPVHCYVAGRIQPKVENDSIAHALKLLMQGESGQELSAKALYPILCLAEHRHLAREVEWQLVIDDMVAYEIKPSSESCLDELIASLRPSVLPSDAHIAVGQLSDAPIDFEQPPKLLCHHIMHKSRDFLVSGISEALKKYASSEKCDQDLLTNQVLEAILSHTHNLGINDAERALNYVCWNYPDIYAVAYKMLKGGFENDSQDPQGFTLEDIFYESYPLQGQQQIYQIVFEFKGNSSDLRSRWYCRVDASADYPTLQHGMKRYYG